MALWSALLLRPKGKRLWPLKSSGSISSVLRITIINACMTITTTATIVAFVLGSIATMPPMASAQHTTSGMHSHDQSNYQGVDAVSAITGLSNGYATPNYVENYYELLARNEAHELQQQQQQQQQNQQNQQHHQQQQQYLQRHSTQHNQHHLQAALNSELFNKESSGNGLSLLHTSDHYSSKEGGNVGDAATNGLEVYNMPESGFVPTTLTAAGQHYAASFATTTDKNNAYAAATSPAIAKRNVEQSSEVATSYSNMVTAFNDNTSIGLAHRLHGRLSNYDNAVAGVASGRNANVPGVVGGVHNFVTAYDNDSGNMYNQAHTNEREQQQHFSNYFTPITSASESSSAYGKASNQQHRYLPLNNYHYQDSEQQQQQQQQQQQTSIHSRSSTVPATQQSVSPLSSSTYYDFYKHAADDVPHEYQTWNIVEEQPQRYYYSKDMQHGHKLKESHSNDISEPMAAESAYVIHLGGKKVKTKSKRSDPQSDSYQTYMPAAPTEDDVGSQQQDNTYEHNPQTSNEEADTMQYHRQQLEELQQQLQQQQHQFMTLQHQLIDHDQQLQIQNQHNQYKVSARPTLPPVTTTVRHTPLSLQAISAAPLSKHTHVVRTIPVAHRQQVFVPQKQFVPVEVPNPVITTISKPTPIHIPVSKTVAIQDIKEVKIPIEKVNPYPVERAIPYIVEKRVPYTVEKQVAKPYYYSVPIKVPIVHTVVHKVHTVHPKHYTTQNHISPSVNYKGHTRHVHHGLSHNHYGGQYL